MNVLFMSIVVCISLHATENLNHTMYGCYLMPGIFKLKLHNSYKTPIIDSVNFY